MKKIVLAIVICVGLMMGGLVSSANATLITINLYTPYVAYGEETNVPDILDAIAAAPFNITLPPELYKSEPKTNSESGVLAGSYQTTYAPPAPTEVGESATISYVGGSIVGPTAYLLAKDGIANDDNTATHAWYLYNLTDLGWTGIEDISITGLWPDQGSFSHISLYGTTGTAVPEPTTLLLLGFGLVGLAGATRRFRK